MFNNFKKKNGRAPRILHVGNIANNAYLNAKFLRKEGLEVDVLCFDYYHILSSPEWEEALLTSTRDDYSPRFDKLVTNDYKRPEWFVQGPLLLCHDYIKAKFKGRKLYCLILRKLMLRCCGSSDFHKFFILITYFYVGRFRLAYEKFDELYTFGFFKKIYKITKIMLVNIYNVPKTLFIKCRNIVLEIAILIWHKIKKIKNRALSSPITEEHIQSLIENFEKLFPGRIDRLSREDVTYFAQMSNVWKNIASHYDIIQCYSTDPIWMLLANKKPYVAFEHGTLRVFTQDDKPLHRLTALAYRMADHVFITNGDCLEYAKKLELNNFSPMIHPINIEQHEQKQSEVALLRKKYNADILLLCPIRHDWSVKGTDVHLRALPLICKKITGKVLLLLANWGGDVEKSKTLIKTLGCEDKVMWIEPLCRLELIKHMQAFDVVLDQMALPCFGSTAPQALAAGTPIIMSYKPESTAWIVNEAAPILSAFTPEDVVQAVLQALNPHYRLKFKEEARHWIHSQHHINRAVKEHMKVYSKILEEET